MVPPLHGQCLVFLCSIRHRSIVHRSTKYRLEYLHSTWRQLLPPIASPIGHPSTDPQSPSAGSPSKAVVPPDAYSYTCSSTAVASLHWNPDRVVLFCHHVPKSPSLTVHYLYPRYHSLCCRRHLQQHIMYCILHLYSLHYLSCHGLCLCSFYSLAMHLAMSPTALLSGCVVLSLQHQILWNQYLSIVFYQVLVKFVVFFWLCFLYWPICRVLDGRKDEYWLKTNWKLLLQ